MSEGKTGRVPGIQPEGGQRLTTSKMFQDRLIEGHVPGATRGRSNEKSPCVHKGYCTQETKIFFKMKKQGKPAVFCCKITGQGSIEMPPYGSLLSSQAAVLQSAARLWRLNFEI